MPTNVTVNAVRPSIQYIVNGAQKDFDIPFAIFSKSDLDVFLGQLALTTGFSVDLSNPNGGVINFSEPPAAGSTPPR